MNYVDEVRNNVYDRMISERNRIADQFRSEGQGEARVIEGNKSGTWPNTIRSSPGGGKDPGRGRRKSHGHLCSRLQQKCPVEGIVQLCPGHGKSGKVLRRTNAHHPYHRQRIVPLPEADQLSGRALGGAHRRIYGTAGGIWLIRNTASRSLFRGPSTYRPRGVLTRARSETSPSR
jgi:hypothetical protein